MRVNQKRTQEILLLTPLCRLLFFHLVRPSSHSCCFHCHVLSISLLLSCLLPFSSTSDCSLRLSNEGHSLLAEWKVPTHIPKERAPESLKRWFDDITELFSLLITRKKEEERRRNHENDEDKISEWNPSSLGTTTIGFNDFNGLFLTRRPLPRWVQNAWNALECGKNEKKTEKRECCRTFRIFRGNYDNVFKVLTGFLCYPGSLCVHNTFLSRFSMIMLSVGRNSLEIK